MSHRILVSLGKRLANVGSRDVELLGLLVGVYCALGVDCTPADLIGVVCVALCVAVVEGNTH